MFLSFASLSPFELWLQSNRPLTLPFRLFLPLQRPCGGGDSCYPSALSYQPPFPFFLAPPFLPKAPTRTRADPPLYRSDQSSPSPSLEKSFIFWFFSISIYSRRNEKYKRGSKTFPAKIPKKVFFFSQQTSTFFFLFPVPFPFPSVDPPATTTICTRESVREYRVEKEQSSPLHTPCKNRNHRQR